MTQRKRFSAEFKREAVRLLETDERSAAVLARDLDIRRNQLYKWRDQLRDKAEAAFSRRPGPSRLTRNPSLSGCDVNSNRSKSSATS